MKVSLLLPGTVQELELTFSKSKKPPTPERCLLRAAEQHSITVQEQKCLLFTG